MISKLLITATFTVDILVKVKNKLCVAFCQFMNDLVCVRGIFGNILINWCVMVIYWLTYNNMQCNYNGRAKCVIFK